MVASAARLFFAFLALAVLSGAARAEGTPMATSPGAAPALSLAEALRAGEAASPALRAGLERENQASAAVWSTASFYFPHVVAGAGTGAGLAGSPGLAPLGEAGVIGSPFRAGPKIGADVSAYWDVLNVGQMLATEAARSDKLSALDQERLLRVQVDQATLIQYYDAAAALGLAEVWGGEAERVQAVYREVKHYESVGRYSEVQLLLLQEMLEQARLAADAAQETERFSLQDLAVTLDKAGAALRVPAPGELAEGDLAAIHAGEANPLLALFESQLKAARSREGAALAQGLPRIFANASVGTVSKTLIVPDADYSLGVGVALPLFEGFQNLAEYKRSRALTREKQDLVDDTRRQITLANDRYDDAVALARLRLRSLQPRLLAARRNLSLSKERYFHLLSPLSDLQQALANLTEIELELNAARTDLLRALGAQRLFNGGTVDGSPGFGV